jgi:hypothetical protein
MAPHYHKQKDVESLDVGKKMPKENPKMAAGKTMGPPAMGRGVQKK